MGTTSCRNPIDYLVSFPDVQRPVVGWSVRVGRSPGIISPEVAGNEESRVSLRRMNKILFSFHAAKRARPPCRAVEDRD